MNAAPSPEATTTTIFTEARELVDGAFYVVRQRWGTYVSHGEDGTPLVTSLTEEACVAATRFHLKGLQDGSFCDNTATTYSGEVGGKL